MFKTQKAVSLVDSAQLVWLASFSIDFLEKKQDFIMFEYVL